MKLREAAVNYIKAKITWTNCMQAHFIQLCHRCKSWSSCRVYKEYVQTWIDLQECAK